jgi:DHA2 family multidrug resistance protein-like MFS transporter
MSSALIRATYPSSQLGRGLGVNAVVLTSASALAPTLGGLILSVGPWPWVFAAAVPFALLSLLFGRALPDPVKRDEPYDVLGAVLCASTFGLVVTGIETGVHGNSPVVSAAMVLAGLVIGRNFVQRELSASEPMLPLDLLAVPALGLAVAGAFASFIATMTMIVVIPFRLQSEFGMSPSQVGAIFAAWPLSALFISPLSGVLSDRIAVAKLCTAGSLIAITGMLLFAFLPPDASGWDMAWRLALLGSGFALFASPNGRSIIGAAPLSRAAAAGGLIATTRLLGQTFGATTGAALLAMGLGTGSLPGIIAACLMGFALLSAITRQRAQIRPGPTPDLPDM